MAVDNLERGDCYVENGGEVYVLHRVRGVPWGAQILVAYEYEHGNPPKGTAWETELWVAGEAEDRAQEVVDTDAVSAVPWEVEAEALQRHTVFTEREAQVATLRWRGWERREIADELGITPNTVDNTRRAMEHRRDKAAATPLNPVYEPR